MGKKFNCPVCEKQISIKLKSCKFCGADLSVDEIQISKMRENYKIGMARNLFQNKDVLGALNILNETLKEFPQSVSALGWAGAIRLSIGHYQQGFEMFKKLVSIDPTNSEAWLKIAICHSEFTEYQKTIDACNTCLKYDPEKCDALVLMGNSYKFLGNYKSAADCYQRALKINSSHMTAAQNYIGSVNESGDEILKHQMKEFLLKEIFKITPITLPNMEGRGLRFYNFGAIEQKFGDIQFKINLFVQFNQIPLEQMNAFVIDNQMIVSIEEYPDAFKEFQKAYNVEPITFKRKTN
ncbi:MAG: tetratricopeptide repeat protein [Promethearchaeota archaeon]